MEQLGTDFNATGSVMNRSELEELRKKRGECVTCGRKCFRKKLFKMIPIDDHGRVLQGRCLNCRPLNSSDFADGGGLPAVSRPATVEDLARFSRSQSNLALKGPGVGGVGVNRNGMTGRPSDSGSTASSSSMQRFPRRISNTIPRRAESTGSASSRHSVARSASLVPSDEASSRHSVARSVSLVPSGSGPMADPPSRTASINTNTSESQALALPSPSDMSQNGGSSHDPQPERAPLNRYNSRRSFTSTRSGSGQSLRSQESSDFSSGNTPGGNGSGNAMLESPPEERKPTSEELQRAAQTILAAKKYGFHEEAFQDDTYEDIRDMNGRMEQYNPDEYKIHCEPQDREYEQDVGVHAGSNRSLRSASSLGDGSAADEFDIPQHGVLNRGGEFAFSMPNLASGSNREVGRHAVSGSSRTLSSMSSIDEDPQPMIGNFGRGMSSQRLKAVNAVYEEADECSRSSMGSAALSQVSSRHTGSSRNSEKSEQHFIERLRSAGANYSEILVVLQEAISMPLVIKEGLEELACNQLDAHDQDTLSDLDAPHIIIDAMQAHLNTMEVQLWGCGAIWNMSGTLRNQLAFVDAGAIDLILAAMDHYLDDIDVQEKAMATISNLGAAEENLPVLVNKGAVGRIVEAMNKHSDIGSVQIKGCSAVTNLASHTSPLKQQIMDLGGGGAVVISMVMHPEDFLLQEKALRALRNLCANSEENKVELANIGGIDAVISAMQVHRDEPGVQEEGAWTLSNLAGNDDNKAVIGDCGGIDVIIRAMWVHSDNVGVQEWCCRALYTLSLDLHNGNVVLEVGGISAVVNAMQAHVDSPAVQEMGCAVLGNLANSDNNKMRIVDEEALDAIVLAMVLYGDDSQVQERACMVLLRLAIGENFKSMLAANICELVRVAAGKFPDKCDEPARRLLHVLEAGAY
jgi:hypothetical protein